MRAINTLWRVTIVVHEKHTNIGGEQIPMSPNCKILTVSDGLNVLRRVVCEIAH